MNSNNRELMEFIDEYTVALGQYHIEWDYEKDLSIEIPLNIYKTLKKYADIVPLLIKEIKAKTLIMYSQKSGDYGTKYKKSYTYTQNEIIQDLIEENTALLAKLEYLSKANVKEIQQWKKDPSKRLVKGALSTIEKAGGQLSINKEVKS